MTEDLFTWALEKEDGPPPDRRGEWWRRPGDPPAKVLPERIGVLPDPPAQRHSQTSSWAGEKIRRRGTDRDQGLMIRDYLVARGREGATRNEIANDLGLLIQSVCARVNKLIEIGLVYGSDLKRVSSYGIKSQIVYWSTFAGIAKEHGG